MIGINGEKFTPEMKREYDYLIVSRITDIMEDLNPVSKEMKKYGIQNRVKKTCFNCGQVWYPAIDTSSFFVDGLSMI